MEAVEVVLHPHVERGRDGALFLVAADVQVAVGAAVGQAVDQPGVAVEAEDDVLVLGEQRVVVGVAQPVGVLGAGLQLHQVDDIDHPHLQLRQVLAQDRGGGQDLQRGRVPATGHDDVRLGSLVVAGPVPDADPLGAVHDRCVHAQPLRQCVLCPPPRR